jgi:hypothetical protein
VRVCELFADGPPASSQCSAMLRGLFDHLTTLTRNEIRYPRNRHRHTHARRTHPRPTPILRTHRHSHPTRPHVVRRTTTPNQPTPSRTEASTNQDQATSEYSSARTNWLLPAIATERNRVSLTWVTIQVARYWRYHLHGLIHVWSRQSQPQPAHKSAAAGTVLHIGVVSSERGED